jgi:hypothetical protein
MLNWLLDPGTSKAAQPAWVPEMVDRVSRHVEDQVFAITGRRGAPVPLYSSMTDLLIGAYILGALEGYARTIPDVQSAPALDSTRELVRGVATDVCARVFGPEWVQWVRSRLPQWDGPPAYHPTFRRELSSMGCRGARDGRCLATNDPLSFAKAGSLLAFLLELTEPQT